MAQTGMDRPLQIVFRNMESSPALDAAIRQRVERLRQQAHITGCRVVAEIPHRSAGGAKPPLAISVELELRGRPAIVVKDSETRREAKGDQLAVVTHVFEAVERQLREAHGGRKGAARQLAEDGSISLG
ncbi:MAG: HPF/RaiA family ribosome-associated protein [Ferrovibrio sp.]|uniref:HPF/RaiA family ribosome-associated protein n=1 Tax=Ferrovibrio sp. TaxID=1917215 RepID=UPI00261C456D|nr:HPF/RaiA family ribosome-associated protein [Ferrovibrio sp.]MCW0232409.1 HPF/RaiA family ribosome-associated protein [Ferrovibrio sp.]